MGRFSKPSLLRDEVLFVGALLLTGCVEPGGAMKPGESVLSGTREASLRPNPYRVSFPNLEEGNASLTTELNILAKIWADDTGKVTRVELPDKLPANFPHRFGLTSPADLIGPRARQEFPKVQALLLGQKVLSPALIKMPMPIWIVIRGRPDVAPTVHSAPIGG